VEAAKPEGPNWGWVLGEGAVSPSPPARGLGACCKLPECGPGQNPGQKDLDALLILLEAIS